MQGVPEHLGELLARPKVALLMGLLNDDGAETRIVGGAVRNILLGLATTDIDFTTSLKPDEVMARAAKAGIKTVPTGIAHGTVTLVVGKTPFEVTTLRHDVQTDGRHAIVAFADTFEEDAIRRDFTINQLSLSLDGKVHDYAGGLADLAIRKLRFIGDAQRRISEDYLRIMRFFRFHAVYGRGAVDADGLKACAALKGGMARLSSERIWLELKKLLVADGAADIMPVFVESGIWQAASGDVAAHVPAFHAALAAFPQGDALARLAALGVRTAEDVRALDLKLKFGGQERKRLEDVAALLAKWSGPGELALSGGLDDRAVRLAGLQTGAQAVLDALGVITGPLGAGPAQAFAALTVPVMPFKGKDVLALGVSAGPAVGAIIQRATMLWADLGFPDDPVLQARCLASAMPG